MSQNISFPVLLAIPMLPLMGAVFSGVFGTSLGSNKIGRRSSHLVTILCVLVAFMLSAATLKSVIVDKAYFNETLYTWMTVGSLKMEVGFLVDSLTATMMCVVTFVSLMVHIYSVGYMEEDEGYSRFFGYLSLFTFAMLMLVMSNNMLQLFFGWEAVGLVSYLLIGFYYNKPSATHANMKAFLVNRVGDFGFILGIGLIVAYAGTLNYSEAFSKGDEIAKIVLPGTEWMLITVICICLFIGAMGKSAQFPLHVWLPDSMEGPTPISALIHAATMVTAGIFMVARMSPLFELSDTALSFIMIVGGITALFMGLLGIIQNDIKRVIAYSTLSQLGYMTVALGASAYSVAIFHLMTHAFFKALLFLAAGSVIMGTHHNQDIRWMGGLRKYMPITWITFLIGSLALIGTPLLSGFYSKDSIIEAAHASHLVGANFAYFSLLAGVFITALYSFRLYFLVFHGDERYKKDPSSDNHSHHGKGADHKPHESPWTVTMPLVLLAIPSATIGFVAIQPMLFGEYFKEVIFVNSNKHPSIEEITKLFSGSVQMALHGLTTAPFWLALAGVVLAWYLYIFNPKLPSAIKAKMNPIFNILNNKYYLDWFNERVLSRGARFLGLVFWKIGDRMVIDGILVNGSWKLVRWLTSVVRRLQSGYIYHYAFGMIIGLLILMTYFVWFVK